MPKGTLCFIALCFFVASCDAQEASRVKIDVNIKEDLKNYLLSHYDDIKIAEFFSKKAIKKAT